MQKTVTVAEAIEAMRQNNIPLLQGSLVSYDSRGRIFAGVAVIGSACALGQCAINLGAAPFSVQEALGKIQLRVNGIKTNLASYIVERNDTYKVSPDQVAKDILSKLSSRELEQTITIETEFSIVVLKAS